MPVTAVGYYKKYHTTDIFSSAGRRVFIPLQKTAKNLQTKRPFAGNRLFICLFYKKPLKMHYFFVIVGSLYKITVAIG